jgi:tetratricopeptide (TPR) repeat protein
MNSGRNFRARRRAEIEAEHSRQKALTENLEALKAVKSKELRAIKKLQANVRGYLCRLHVVPKYHQEKQTYDKYTIKEVFKYYTNRQAKLETTKERVYYTAKIEYEKLQSSFANAIDVTTLRHFVQDSNLKWTRANINATIDDLKKMYTERALKQAMQKCEEVNIDFRYLQLEDKKHVDLTTIFVYFSKAITYGNLLIMLRDFKLLSNQSSHGTILQLFQKYAVKIEEEREKVRATFLYRYYGEKYEAILTAERISEMLIFLGCHHDTTDEAKELLNGETSLSERDFLKFWQKHVGNKLIEIRELHQKNLKAEQKLGTKKKSDAVQLNRLGLKRAGFEALLLDVCTMYYPKGTYCRCRACKNQNLPPRTTPQEVHGKFAMRKALRYHIGPSIYLLEQSGLCGMGTIAGRNILDFKKHLRWWLRFELNLRSLYVFYATRGWELSPEERKTWDDVTKNNTTLPYSEFVRFTTDFGIYPKYLTNERYTGFQILHAFLLSCQGNRSDPFHICRFNSSISVGETSTDRGGMSSNVCSLCGSRQIILSSHEERRLEREFELFSNEDDNLVFVKDVPELFEHAGEDPLPAQMYVVDKILRKISKVKKKDEDGEEEECINESQFLFAIDQGRRLRFQALSNEITFAEFLHAISILAIKAFTYEKLQDGWENPMQEIFKIMDPTFRSKFGHSIETVVEENTEKDLMIHEVKSTFKGMLKTLFERYKFLESGLNSNEQGMTSDAFQLFVKDCRLVPNIGHAQALNMFKASVKASKASVGALKMTFEQFFSAINGLMFENFCNSKKKPAPMSYFEPIGPGTGITCAGLAIRNAISKLKILYEEYNPIGRSTGKGTKNVTLNINLGTMTSPENRKLEETVSGSSKNSNKSGQYLHLMKKGAKGKQKSMAKLRLKRAIRLKSSNLMKLSKLGFGTSVRRDSRLNHIQNLIWDVAEHSDKPDDEAIFSSDDNRSNSDDDDADAKEDILLMTPSAPPSRFARLQDRKRPGRQLKKQEKKKLSNFHNYINIWRTEPERVRSLLGEDQEKPPVLPGIYQSLPTKLSMKMTIDTIEKIKYKNVKAINWMDQTLNRLNPIKRTIDTSHESMQVLKNHIDGFGHPELIHTIKRTPFHTHEHAIPHFHDAHTHLHKGNQEEASNALKIGLGIAMEMLESANNFTSSDDGPDSIQELGTANNNVVNHSANICHFYQALACVADITNSKDDSELFRIHQVHFARNTQDLQRDSLLMLSSDSLALHYLRYDRLEEAEKIYKSCLQNDTNGNGSTNVTAANDKLTVDPYLHGRLLLNLSKVYRKMGNPHDAIKTCEKYIKLMQKEKDYKKQQHGLKLIGNIYFDENEIPKAIEKWNDSLAYCPKASLERCQIHLLMAKAYKHIKNYSLLALQYSHIIQLHESARSDEDTICKYIKFQAEALTKSLNPRNSLPRTAAKIECNDTCFSIINLYSKYIDIRSVFGGLSNEKDICIAYLKIGDIYFSYLNEYGNAADSYDRATYTVQYRKGSQLFTKSHFKLGLTLARLRDDKNAERILNIALTSSLDKESISDQQHLSKYILNQLGKLKAKYKDHVAATKCFTQYLNISKLTKDIECEMDAYFHLGMTLLQAFDNGCQHDVVNEISINAIINNGKSNPGNQNILELATSMFNALRQLSTENKDLKRESQSFVGLAECASRRKLLTVAVGFYKSAIDIQKTTGDKRGEMEQCGNVGMLTIY